MPTIRSKNKNCFMSCTQSDSIFFSYSFFSKNERWTFFPKLNADRHIYNALWINRMPNWPKRLYIHTYTHSKKENNSTEKKAWRKFKMCSQIPNYFCQLLLCLDGMFNRTLSTSKIIYYHLKTACTPGDVRLPSCEKMMATHLPASAKYLLI